MIRPCIAHADPPGALLPAVSFFGGFRTPALVPVDRSALAGIRNPSQQRTSSAQLQMSCQMERNARPLQPLSGSPRNSDQVPELPAANARAYRLPAIALRSEASAWVAYFA
jgi:hypothetical protein